MLGEGDPPTDAGECASIGTSFPSSSQSSSSSSSFLGKLLVACYRHVETLSESRPILHLTTAMRHVLSLLLASSSQVDVLAPSPFDVARTLVTVGITLALYHLLFGNRHWRRRRRLAKELDVAKEQLTFLEEKLRRPNPEDDDDDDDDDDDSYCHGLGTGRRQGKKARKQREIRIFMDGAFDMMHFGHMNAFRLARSLGTHLVVGVNSDESIEECKGAPLMNDSERLAMVESCKFVDEVVPDCPYIMNKEYIDWIFERYDVDYVVHGDDPCIVDGKDVYATAKEAGKFRTIPRTEGVSTTDIVGRMLLLTKEHHMSKIGTGVLGSQSKFLTTTRLLQLFSANVKSPTASMRVIYIDGAWDMFHPGHVAILKAAKERGDYLVVGIHGDAIVNKTRGMNLPLLNLHERVLSVLGCRFVDDVLIDAPYEITPEMISSLRIAEVIHGSCDEDEDDYNDQGERFRHAREAGIFHVVESPSDFRLERIFKRIHRNQATFQARFERKMKAETHHYQAKYGGDSRNGAN